MADKKEPSFQNKVENSVASFVKRNTKAIIITGVALLVILVGLWIGLSVSSSNRSSLQESIDTLGEQYTEWVSMEDLSSEEAADALAVLKEDLTDLAGRTGSSYATVKANYLLGLIETRLESYETALDYFLTAAEKGKDSYLSPLSLFNAAVTSEKLGDTLKALEYYQRVYDDTQGQAAESARALFNVGRLYEESGDIELAEAVLQQLADEYPNSEYAKLAQSRLVIL
ncbi:MAG: tetratricopeptide repeat protein [Sphaerochaetaceae bacterium]|nr:tetratricopeptide repeat protein [Sphaerochaetaceae bacterium]